MDPRFNGLRVLLAAGTGTLWALSFPSANLSALAWVVPGALLGLTAGLAPGAAFRWAYAAGAVHYLISLSWLRYIPFPVGAYTGWLALSLFLALFPGLWVLICWRLAHSLRIITHPIAGWAQLAREAATQPWFRLAIWSLLCAAAWVSWEMVLARIFGGFPWNLLGVSQHRILPLIQIASVTGVYGVSFMVVWFSTGLLMAVLLLVKKPAKAWVWRGPLIFPGLMVAATLLSGFVTLTTDSPVTRRFSVALIQPSIPQTVIFDPDASTSRFETLLRLTEQAVAAGPDLLVWPEASLPGGLSQEQLDRLTALVRGAGVWMILGADDVETVETGSGEERRRAFNSAFLLNGRGEVVAGYRKRRLVMFGEYIPFGRWLPFLQHLAPIGDGFEAGTEAVQFDIGSLNLQTSVLICFEDNFPHQAREHARPGTDFLINVTNDAWFGRSAAQWQHAANAAFRAIENGIPLVRCANNGISCWIDPRGRFHSARLAQGRDVYEAGFEVTTVELRPGERTMYNIVGDLFGWSCAAATVLGMALPRPRPRRGR